MRVARSAFTSFSVAHRGPRFVLRGKNLAHLPRAQSQRSACTVQAIALGDTISPLEIASSYSIACRKNIDDIATRKTRQATDTTLSVARWYHPARANGKVVRWIGTLGASC
jgi:hypothetical protein